MKLYLSPEDGYFHECLAPLFRCVYRLQEDGYYKCPVCIFKFPGVLLLGSKKDRTIIRRDTRTLYKDSNYEQLGRVPSVERSYIFSCLKQGIIKVIDV